MFAQKLELTINWSHEHQTCKTASCADEEVIQITAIRSRSKNHFAARDSGLIITDESSMPPKCKLTERGYQVRKFVLLSKTSLP